MTRVVLKQNRYKLVELDHRSDGVPYIRKRLSGHLEANLRANNRHNYCALRLLSQHFSSIVNTPAPISIDQTKYEVHMEYIPELIRSAPLKTATIHLTRPFFERCYQLHSNYGFLRDMSDSVLATPQVLHLIRSGFAQSLGFKGDLYENLRVLERKLYLADVETLCLEPMGLSELVLYGECVASRDILGSVSTGLKKLARPVAWDMMNHHEAGLMSSTALELLTLRMAHLSPPLRRIKLAIVKFVFSRLLNR